MKLSMFCESTVCLEGVPVPTHAAQREKTERIQLWLGTHKDGHEGDCACLSTNSEAPFNNNATHLWRHAGVAYCTLKVKDNFIVNLSTFSGNS